jgi:hypothetical protein
LFAKKLIGTQINRPVRRLSALDFAAQLPFDRKTVIFNRRDTEAEIHFQNRRRIFCPVAVAGRSRIFISANFFVRGQRRSEG